MSDTNIDEATVRRLAGLAALSLSDEEASRMAGELSDIVRHIDQLQAVDVSDVPATAQVLIDQLSTRPDVVAPSLARKTALEQAPLSEAGGFVVPTFVDEG